ncbi:S26 family signal peptidase [Stakelama pacifica]|uniref:Conjugative transfer signal peptidase TraF n=1 Tax=Stakelama pacifica TaxID=517720 RepID=A0A4R6FRR3_9SPHN|nr:S26 family signal peptidase [Stakelama pacifica]TDN83524.1 conjugative transfer signal peptidase TraF [Stakelama pacifica]GGO94071.1 peptidase S26 [Stakelama pacifica]
MANAPHLSPQPSAPDRQLRHFSNRLRLIATGTAALAGLLLPTIHHPPVRLIWNASASVPLGLYRIDPAPALRVGDMVAVRPSPTLARFLAGRRYVEANVPLLKPIAATGGATICRLGLRVTVNGWTTTSALPRDRAGRPLPSWSGCRRLKPDQLFLIAPVHRDSFDSRYFGPVDRHQVLGIATPIWTWS